MIASILATAVCRALPERKQVPAAQPRESVQHSPLQGMRFQLMLALGVLDRGHMAVLRVEQQERAEGRAVDRRKQAVLRSDNDFVEPVLPLWVPGTMHPAPVGKALLELGWIKPAAREHWIPLLRFFEISESGKHNLLRAREWWRQLGPLEKIAAMVAE